MMLLVAMLMNGNQQNEDEELHRQTMVFCQHWNDGEFSDCDTWVDQKLASHREAVHYCLTTYEQNSIQELGCMLETGE
jgi:hypothetical protein